MRVWNAIGNFFRRLWGITLGQLIKVLAIAAVALILLLFVGLAAASLWPNSKVPLRESVHEIVYLDQGWGQGQDARERQAYYYTPQGTTIKGLRYSWFVNLERPLGLAAICRPGPHARIRFHCGPETFRGKSVPVARRIHPSLCRRDS